MALRVYERSSARRQGDGYTHRHPLAAIVIFEFKLGKMSEYR